MSTSVNAAAPAVSIPCCLKGPHAVFVVDDDRSVRDRLAALLAELELNVVTFESAREYIAYEKPDVPACLMVDVWLPDIDSLQLHGEGAPPHPPLVFIAGEADIPAPVRALKTVDFLTKPFSLAQLLDAIESAVGRDQYDRVTRSALIELQRRYEMLTPREKEVLPLVISGLLNKQAAAALGISEVTLQIHRSRVMRKMAAESLADLVRMAIQLGIPSVTRAVGPRADPRDCMDDRETAKANSAWFNTLPAGTAAGDTKGD